MPKYIYLNNRDTTLTAALNSAATSLPTSSLASNIINRTFVLDEVLKITLTNATGTSVEIIDVVSGSNPTYTIVRGGEGTTAQTWPIGTKVSIRLTAAELTDMPFSPDTSSILGLVKTSHETQAAILTAPVRSNSLLVFRDEWLIDNVGAPEAWRCLRRGTTGASYAPVTFNSAPRLVRDGTAIFHRVPLENITTRKISDTSVSYGDRSSSSIFSLAIGSAVAIGSSLAIGPQGADNPTVACGSRSVAIRGQALGDDSVAINGGYAPYPNSLSLNQIPLKPQILTFKQPQCNLEGILWSGPMDLTGGTTWVASALTKHGYSTKPTIANGFQYLRVDNNNYNYLDKFTNNTYTPSPIGSINPSQPTWSLVDNDDVWDGSSNGFYVVKANVGHSIPLDTKFMVTQVGFVAYDVASVTVQPFISVGISGNNTRYVANVQTTGLTANDTMQIFTTVPGIADTLTVSINTLATGTRLLGQFFFKGFYAPSWF
jgi:hypothetical protein